MAGSDNLTQEEWDYKRDQFAMHAMGVVFDIIHQKYRTVLTEEEIANKVAEQSFVLADAMMRSR